jgi:hypothetical protein
MSSEGKMSREYSFEIWYDGMMVAGVSCPDVERLRSSVMHYAMVYGQDGPVENSRPRRAFYSCRKMPISLGLRKCTGNADAKENRL